MFGTLFKIRHYDIASWCLAHLASMWIVCMGIVEEFFKEMKD